jgi:hypothetical protein
MVLYADRPRSRSPSGYGSWCIRRRSPGPLTSKEVVSFDEEEIIISFGDKEEPLPQQLHLLAEAAVTDDECQRQMELMIERSLQSP